MEDVEALIESNEGLIAESRSRINSSCANLLSGSFTAGSKEQELTNEKHGAFPLEELLSCLAHSFPEEVPETFCDLFWNIVRQPQMALLDSLLKLLRDYYAAQGLSARLTTIQKASAPLDRRERLVLAKVENDLFRLIEKPSRAYLDVLDSAAVRVKKMTTEKRLAAPAPALMRYLGDFQGLRWAAEQFDSVSGMGLANSQVATKLRKYAELKNRVTEVEKRIAHLSCNEKIAEYTREVNNVGFDISRLESNINDTFVARDIVNVFVEALFPWKVIESSPLVTRLRYKDIVFIFSRGTNWTDVPSHWTLSFEPKVSRAYPPLQELERDFWTSFCRSSVISDCAKFRERFPRVHRFSLVLSSMQKLIDGAAATLEEFIQVSSEHRGTRLVDSALIVPFGDGKEFTFKVDITSYPSTNSVTFDGKNNTDLDSLYMEEKRSEKFSIQRFCKKAHAAT